MMSAVATACHSRDHGCSSSRPTGNNGGEDRQQYLETSQIWQIFGMMCCWCGLSISRTARISNDNFFSIAAKKFVRASLENGSAPSLRMDQLCGIGLWVYNYLIL